MSLATPDKNPNVSDEALREGEGRQALQEVHAGLERIVLQSVRGNGYHPHDEGQSNATPVSLS